MTAVTGGGYRDGLSRDHDQRDLAAAQLYEAARAAEPEIEGAIARSTRSRSAARTCAGSIEGYAKFARLSAAPPRVSGALLAAVVRYELPLEPVLAELASHPWDSTEESPLGTRG